MSRRRGLTLPEMLVACALASLVLTGLATLFVQSVRYHRALEVSLELQQSNLAAMALLSRDLSEGNPASLRTEPGGLVMGSPRDLVGNLQADSQGRLMWRKYICYYLAPINGVNCLLRKEQALPVPLDTAPILPDTLDVLFFRISATPYSVLARNLEQLEISGSNPVSIRLVSSRTVANELFRIESRSDVVAKN